MCPWIKTVTGFGFVIGKASIRRIDIFDQSVVSIEKRPDYRV